MTLPHPHAGSSLSGSVPDSTDEASPSYWRSTILGVVLSITLVHILFLWGNRGPVLYQDALGYLGNARFLAGGTPPHFDGSGYYNAGYSLLLVPVYWLTERSGIVWGAAITINVMLAVAVLVPAYYLARRMFGLSRRPALLAAATAALTPALLLQPGRIWVETLFPLVFLTAAALILSMLETRRGVVALAAGLATGYLVLIHGRGFAAFTALIVVILTGWLIHALPLRLTALAVAGAVVGVAADRVLRSYLISHLWADSSPAHGSPVEIVFRSLAPDRLEATSVVALGHVWYVTVATFGIGILGLVALLVLMYRGRHADPNRPGALVSMFLVLSIMGALTLSASFLGATDRLDTRVYGRYLDAFAPALVLAGSAWILSRQAAWRVTLVAAAIVPAFGVLFFAVAGPDAMHGNAIKLTIPGLLGLQTIVSGSGGTWLKHLDVIAISALAGLLGALVAAAARWRQTAGAVAIIIITLAVTSVGKVTSWDPFVTFFFDGFNSVPTALRDAPEYDPVPYDMRFFLVDTRNLYEFRLAPRRLTFVDNWCDLPPTDLVVSTDNPAQLPSEATMVAVDPLPKQALWLVGESLGTSCPGT